MSIPDAQEDQWPAVQTHSTGMLASFAGIVCLYEDPTAHAPLCTCKVSNPSVFIIIRLVVHQVTNSEL
jgi:hypothetical protein